MEEEKKYRDEGREYNNADDDDDDDGDGENNQNNPKVLYKFGSTGHEPDEESSSSIQKSLTKRFSIQLTTEQHNRATEKTFYGPYQHLKKNLIDWEYHSLYRKGRQWFHDSIIEEYLCHEEQAKALVPSEPWLVYTCGAKGAGKRYLIDSLMADGRLPLLSTTIVDADEIRRQLPEFSSYVQTSPELVSKKMNKEAGYIGELLCLAALQAGNNVLFDGQLKRAEWHIQQFRKLKALHSHLKIALIHVTAPLDVIMERIELRAKETGLHIPKEPIQRILKEIPGNIERVKPEVDYFCTIENGRGDFELLDDSWEHFSSIFEQEVEHLKCGEKATLLEAIHDTVEHEKGLAVKPDAIRRFVSDRPKKSSPMVKFRRRPSRKLFRVHMSTEENHKADHMKFYGKYSHIRETLDYTYHSNYTYERQKFQDAIITDFLHAAVIEDKDGQLCTTPTEPWLVFTAGAMGAGKSYTMRKLVESGRFPLLGFVTTDPDKIRRYLPEFHLYVDSDPEAAGQLTHKEAGYIAEILTLAGLQAGKNVLVDGSMRNSDWYKTYFKRLRNDFPLLRIAIIHVTAPREAIFQRAAVSEVLVVFLSEQIRSKKCFHKTGNANILSGLL